ncbi:MAG TPA: translocation/assembly module TamB domain-containing protein [Polyangiaceae bacterium]
MKPRARAFLVRGGRLLAKVLLGLVVFVLFVPVALVVALRFDAVRSRVASTVDAALETTFRGRVRIDAVEWVDFTRVRARARVEDAAGRTVVRVDGLEARVLWPALVLRIVSGGQPLRIDLDEVSAAHAEVRLVDDGTGIPTLATAFEPRTPSPPSTEPGPIVSIPKISLKHAWVHGGLGGFSPIDAELRDAEVALELDDRGVNLPVRRAELVARNLLPQRLDPRGSLRGKLWLPSDPAKGPTVDAEYRGSILGTPAEARVSLVDQTLDGRLEAPAVDRAALARLSPDLELAGTARLVATVGGTLPRLDFDVSVDSQAGRVKAQGSVLAEAKTSIQARVQAENINLANILRGGPASALHVSSDLRTTLSDDLVELRYGLQSAPGSVAHQALPAFTTSGIVRWRAETLTVAGEIDADEPGAATHASYEVHSAAGKTRIELRSSSELSEPPRLKSLSGVGLTGKLTTAVGLRFPERVVQGHALLALESAAFPSGAVGPTSVTVGVDGDLEDPRFKVALDARRVRAQGRAFDRARIRAEGTPRRLRLSGRMDGRHPDELWFETTLGTGERTELEHLELALVDREGPLKLSAERVTIASGAVTVKDVLLEGAGRAELSFEQRGRTVRARAKTTDLDLGRLARLTGVALPIKSARATLDAEYASERGKTSGFVVGSVQNLSYDDVRRAHADIDLRLSDQELTGTVTAALAPGARIVLALNELSVPGPPFELPPPDRILGRIALRGTVDLQSLSSLLAKIPSLPVGDARGMVSGEVIYERRAEELPKLQAHLETQKLELAGRLTRKEPIRTTDEAIAASTWNLREVDVRFDLELDSAAHRVKLAGNAFDEHGDLVRVEAEASDLPAVASFAELARSWQDVPLRVGVRVPERKLRQLPQPIRPQATNGTLSVAVDLEGSVRKPRLHVAGKLGRLRAAGGRMAGERPDRIDVDFQADYEPRGGSFAASARHESDPVLEVSGDWEGDALEFDPKHPDDSLLLRAEARLDKLKLETLAALKNRQITGEVTGEARVEYGRGRREVALSASGSKLELGRVVLDSVRADLLAREGELRGDVNVRGKGGALDAAIRSGLAWRGKLAPEPAGDIDARLDARDFRLGALWPFASTSLSELDGRLSVNLGAKVRNGRLRLTGKGRIEEGVVQIPALGQRLDRISGNIEVEPEEIRLRGVRAHGVTGSLSAASDIVLDEQLALRELRASVHVNERQRLPVTYEGVAIGDVWGDIRAKFQRGTEEDRVEVKLSNVHFVVPDTDQRSVQSLEPAEGVRIGVRQKDQKFVAIPVQPLERGSAGEEIKPMTIDIDLGKSLSIQRGETVDAQLTGKLTARVAEETSVTGEIQVTGGTLDVSGKRFEIERGTVAFTGGDPSNPTVTAIARWDSPAGYTIYAEYAGTAENGHLKLRSEPPLTEDQVVTLLMFGTPDGSFAGDSSGGSSEDTAATAVSVAGSTATRGLNRALSKVTNLDVQARIDTSTGSSRPEIVVGLSPRLSARVTRAIGEPAPGTSPDRTFLTLELRLKRNWALSALVGDRGASALDLIWRHRY